MKTIFLHYYIVFKSMSLTNHFLYVLFSPFFSAWVLFLLYCTLFVRSLALPHKFNVFHFNTIWWSFCHLPCLSINLIELNEFAHYLFWLRFLNTFALLHTFQKSRSPTTVPSLFLGKEAMVANNSQHMDFYILFLSHSQYLPNFLPSPQPLHLYLNLNFY